MTYDVQYLHSDHALVKAANSMVQAHAKHETLVSALEEMKGQFPDVARDHLICLWIGINAKERSQLR